MAPHTSVLTLYCPDSSGIVADVATWIGSSGGNIVDAGETRDAENGIFIQRVEFIKSHHPDRAAYTLLSLAGDFCNAVRWVELETSVEHFLTVSTAAATEFENAGAWRQTLKKRIEMPACATRPAGGVNRRLTGVKVERRLIASGVFGQ